MTSLFLNLINFKTLDTKYYIGNSNKQDSLKKNILNKSLNVQ